MLLEKMEGREGKTREKEERERAVNMVKRYIIIYLQRDGVLAGEICMRTWCSMRVLVEGVSVSEGESMEESEEGARSSRVERGGRVRASEQ